MKPVIKQKSYLFIFATLTAMSLHLPAFAGGGNGSDYSGPSLSSTSTPTGEARAFSGEDAERALLKCYGITYTYSSYDTWGEERTPDEVVQLLRHQLVRYSNRLYNDWIINNHRDDHNWKINDYYKRLDLNVTTHYSDESEHITEKFKNSISVLSITLHDAGRMTVRQTSAEDVGPQVILRSADIESKQYFEWQAMGYLPFYKHDGEAETLKYSKNGVLMKQPYLKNVHVISPPKNFLPFYIKFEDPNGGRPIEKFSGFGLDTQEYTDCLNDEITHPTQTTK